MPLTIINLTPHPVTICRSGREPITYAAGAPSDLPRAIESGEMPTGLDPNPSSPGPKQIGIGRMELTDADSDGQGGYERSVCLADTGLVDFVGYVGVEGLPAQLPGERMFGTSRWYIVSIITALGALVSGRGVEDLLVPMGQVRDAAGRVIGASGLAPATSLLTPLYASIADPLQRRTLEVMLRNTAQPGQSDDAASAMSQPELVEHNIHVHAAHYLYDDPRKGHDLARWVVVHPVQPTHEQIAALGVPATAEYHCGYVHLGRQAWVYVERRPMSPGTCGRCGAAESERLFVRRGLS